MKTRCLNNKIFEWNWKLWTKIKFLDEIIEIIENQVIKQISNYWIKLNKVEKNLNYWMY